VGGALWLLLLAGLASGARSADTWNVEVVEAAGGYFSSLRIDNKGNAHVAHAHPDTRALKYSFWDSALNKWFTTTLDQSNGFCALALDSNQRPHISYLSAGTEKLKYARWDGAEWNKQTIQIRSKRIDFYTSIALDPSDNPTISYYEYQGMGDDLRLNVRNVAWNGKLWEVRTVDGDRESGKFNSIAVDSAGKPHVAYANVHAGTASLRYSRWNGQSWEPVVLEGPGILGYEAFSVSLLLDKHDNPHIAYTEVHTRRAKYATRREGKWEFEVVDQLVNLGYPDRNGITVDEAGRPYVSYYDAGLGQLKLAHKNGAKWITEIVDDNAAGYTSSIRIDRGAIWITYSDEARQLKCARRPLASGELARPAPATAEAAAWPKQR
jgi:hypothetical protein